MITYRVPMLLRTGFESRPIARHEYAVESLIIRDYGNRSLAAVPAEGTSLSRLSFSISTVSLFKYVFEHRVLLRIGEKFADPDDLLEPFISADLKDDLLGARKLAAGRDRAERRKKEDGSPTSAFGSTQANGFPGKLPVVARFSLVLDLDRDMGQSVKSAEQ
jgi:hypothetical protein